MLTVKMLMSAARQVDRADQRWLKGNERVNVKLHVVS
jgi:hypothetical protein